MKKRADRRVLVYVKKGGTVIMGAVTKEMLIGEILRVDEGIAPILLNAGMHCVGCPSAQGETLEEACFVHGMDSEALINEINAFLASA